MSIEPPSDSPRCPQCRGRDGKHKMGCRAWATEPPSDSAESFGARLMRESIEDNERRRAEERIEPPFNSPRVAPCV